MNADEYLEERLDKQQHWYSKNSSKNKKWYYGTKISEFSMAALIPFLTAKPFNIPHTEWIIGVFGVLIAVSSGFASMGKFHENWIQYRTTSETLKHEKYLYLTQAPPYNQPNAFSLLVERVESHISKENSSWSLLSTQKKPAQEPNKP